MARKFLIMFFTIGVVLTTHFAAQIKKDDEVIRVDTQLVDVPVAVNSANGTPLRGLKASNFVVYEDGKRQEASDFSTTAAPFEVALLLDTSGSTRNDLQLIQRAAREFVNSLRPGDRVAILAFNTRRTNEQAFAIPEILTGLTSDRTQLIAATESIKTSNGTPYYDSVLQIVEKVFSERPKEEFRGRRALVALTDAVDSTSAEDFAAIKQGLGLAGVISFFIKVDTRDYFEQALLGDCETAIRFSAAQIRRYYKSFGSRGNMERAVNFCGLGEFERLAISKKLYEIADTEMNDLAKSSGGRVFPVDDLGEARNAFKNVADEIGMRYTLGYYPSNDKRDGTYRKIKVEVVGLPKGTTVRFREGYTAPKN